MSPDRRNESNGGNYCEEDERRSGRGLHMIVVGQASIYWNLFTTRYVFQLLSCCRSSNDNY